MRSSPFPCRRNPHLKRGATPAAPSILALSLVQISFTERPTTSTEMNFLEQVLHFKIPSRKSATTTSVALLVDPFFATNYFSLAPLRSRILSSAFQVCPLSH